MNSNVQIIENADGPEYAVLPVADYEALVARLQELDDSRDIEDARAALEAGAEEMIPANVVARLVDGAHPVKVWREHRGLTQAHVAEQVGLTSAYISQIESGEREGRLRVYVALAKCLGVDLEDLVTE